MVNYIYVIFIFLTLGLIYQGIINSYIYAPSKIKIASISVFFLLFFRYVALIILYLFNNIKYLYLLKPLLLLNTIAIPFIAIVTIYIFYRCDKIKFKYMFIIEGIFVIFYVIILFITSMRFKTYFAYGYVMIFSSQFYISLEYLILNTIFLVIGIKLITIKYLDKLGVFLIILSSITTIISVILFIINIRYMFITVIADFIWVITLDYGLIKFKKH